MSCDAVHSVPHANNHTLFGSQISAEGAALEALQLSPCSTLAPPSWFYADSDSFGDYGDDKATYKSPSAFAHLFCSKH